MNTGLAYLSVFIGGGLGSILRYAISMNTYKLFQPVFPWGTFISNSLASLLLAIIMLFGAPAFMKADTWRLFAIVGFCGGFSTFSTFSFETIELFRSGNYLIATLNIVLSIVVCLLLIWFVTHSLKSS